MNDNKVSQQRCEDKNFISWIQENYAVDLTSGAVKGSGFTAKQIQCHYFEDEKENGVCSIDVTAIGRAIKILFPEAVHKKRRVSGNSVWVYANLVKKSESYGVDTEYQIDDYVKSQANKFGWTLINNDLNSNSFEFVKMEGAQTCNGQRVMKELRLLNVRGLDTWTHEFYVLNNLVACDFLNTSEISLESLFCLTGQVKICQGFQVDTKNDSFNRRKDITGRAESWSERHLTTVPSGQAPKAEELRHRSLNCAYVLNPQSKEAMCKSCHKIKRNSSSLFDKSVKECEERENQKYKREDLMSNEELLQKLHDEKRKRVNAERREKRLREKIENEMLEFTEDDHSDLKSIFDKVNKDDVNPDMKLFWEVQDKILESKSSRGHRWHPKVIRMCLSIWNRSPEAYNELRESGMIKLPSGRLLRYYKNSVDQKPGLNPQILKWMMDEASKRNLKPADKVGGIILDEMAIQEDIQMKIKDGKAQLIGMVDLGKEHEHMSKIESGDDKVELATHVLQFVFLGNGGFRFPFCHYPTKEVDPATLYVKYWEAVLFLLRGGFEAVYCSLDGGQANRSFVQLHFKGRDPVKEKFSTTNIYTRRNHIFYMDPKHNIKKMRNNVEKSKPSGTRLLTFGSETIKWEHFKAAYKWDQMNNSLKLHHKLKEEHFNLGYASRMRNHLAEQVLDEDMLNLVQAHKRYLEDQSNSAVQYLDKTIEFLTFSSKIVKIFNDNGAITSLSDHRLVEMDNCVKWLDEWDSDAAKHQELTTAARNKRLLSDKLRFDLKSSLIGFKEVCKLSFEINPGCSLVPGKVNSDIVENIFCQERGKNGQNDNPTYCQYGPTMNGILIGQTTTTRKSNSGNVESLPFFVPGKLHK